MCRNLEFKCIGWKNCDVAWLCKFSAWSSVRSRRLELEGERENGRARGRQSDCYAVWSMITKLSDIKVVLIVRLFRHLYRERNLKKSIAFEWKNVPDKSWKGIIISQVPFFAATNFGMNFSTPPSFFLKTRRNVLLKIFQIYHIPLLKLLFVRV